MRWSDEMRIETPEQIGVDLELAGVGSRFVAQILDWLWKAVLTFLLIVVLVVIAAFMGNANPFDNPSRAMAAVVIAVLYLLWLGYGIYFEVRWNGQTPGKRIAQIRVVQQNGAAMDARAAFIRNLLAFADFLPSMFILGAILITLTKNRQRLGDLAAGTVVVRERATRDGLDDDADLLEFATESFSFTPSQLAALAPADLSLIRSFLQRYRQMQPKGRERLGLKMVEKYSAKMDYDSEFEIDDGGTAREFLASLLRDLQEYLKRN